MALTDWIKTTVETALKTQTQKLSAAHQDVARRLIDDGIDAALMGVELLGQHLLAAKYPQVAAVISDVTGLDLRTVPATTAGATGTTPSSPAPQAAPAPYTAAPPLSNPAQPSATVTLADGTVISRTTGQPVSAAQPAPATQPPSAPLAPQPASAPGQATVSSGGGPQIVTGSGQP